MDQILDSLDNDKSVTENNIDEQVIISQGKFIFLCIVTLSLYEIWWMYKSWKFFKQKNMPDILPVWRSLFAIFFLHSLFKNILEFAKEKGYPSTYSSTTLFVCFLVANFLGYLPQPFWIISAFSFVLLLPAFKAFNYARLNSPDINVTEQKSFNGRQIVLILLGLILWGFTIYGMNLELTQ